jgi:hypothetical protein
MAMITLYLRRRRDTPGDTLSIETPGEQCSIHIGRDEIRVARGKSEEHGRSAAWPAFPGASARSGAVHCWPVASCGVREK